MLALHFMTLNMEGFFLLVHNIVSLSYDVSARGQKTKL